MNLAPLAIQKFFDNNGNPMNGGLLFTYVVGTTTKIATYTDSTGGTPNTNPIVLDFRGEACVWLDPTLVYKFTLAPPGDTDPPTKPIWTVDNVTSGITFADLTQQIIGRIFYPQSLKEIALSITPANFFRYYGDVDRYGTNTTPGTTTMQGAFNAAFKLAKNTGCDVTYGYSWPYLLTASIDATQNTGTNQYGYSVRNIGQTAATTNNAPAYTCILANHTDHVFDCSGAIEIHWYDASIGTVAGGNEPLTAWFCARNSAGSSTFHRWNNCSVLGKFSKRIRYMYGIEEYDCFGDFFYNDSVVAGAGVECATTNNILGLSSGFITIATGARSTRAGRHHGGSYILANGGATGYVFHLDQVENWYSRDAFVANPGRNIVFADPTNGPSNYVHISGMEVENGVEPTYAIEFGAAGATSTPSGWSIYDSYLKADTRAIFAGANVVLDSFQIRGITEASNFGLEVVTRIQGSTVDTQPIVRVIGESKTTTHIGQAVQWTVTTRTDDTWVDTTSGPSWTPTLGAGFTVTGALTISQAIAEYDGKYVYVQFQASAATSIVAIAGAVVTGLPRAAKDACGIVDCVNQNTFAAIGSGFVNGSSMFCPIINVGVNVTVIFRARYRVA